MSLKELKLLKLAFPFFIGNYLSTNLHFEINIKWLILLFLVASFLSVICLFKYPIKYRWIPNFALLQTILIFGFISAIPHINHLSKNHFSKKDASEHIISIDDISYTNKFIKIIGTAKASIIDNTLQKTLGKTLIYIKKDRASLALEINDYLIIKSNFNKIEDPKNLYVFNYKKYLFYQGIINHFYLSPRDWKKINNIPISSWKKRIAHAKSNLLSQIKTFVTNDDARAVAAALVLGEKSLLNQEIKDNFSKTGGMHVLAVSGLHVGLVTALLLFLVNLLKLKNPFLKLLAAIFIIIGIWSYSLITGMPDSAFRASIMASLFIFGKAINKKTNGINIYLQLVLFL